MWLRTGILAVAICWFTTPSCQAAIQLVMPDDISLAAGELAFLDVAISGDPGDTLTDFLFEFQLTRTAGTGLLPFLDLPFGHPQETLQQADYVFAGNSIDELVLGQTVGSVSTTIFADDTFIASDAAFFFPAPLDVSPAPLLVRLALDAGLATPNDVFSLAPVSATLNGTLVSSLPAPTAVTMTTSSAAAIPEPSSLLLMLGLLTPLIRPRRGVGHLRQRIGENG